MEKHRVQSAEIYRELGVTRIVNAADTYTLFGGGRIDPSVRDAMSAAAEHHVDVPSLLEAVGSEIARLLDVPAALPVNGAASGLAIATAACIAGMDEGRIGSLPDNPGFRNEIVVLRCQRNSYDRAITSAGGRIVEVGYADSTPEWTIRNGITESTAAVFYYTGDQFERFAPPLEEVADLCDEHNVPLVVDAAAQLPPVSNLWRYLERGADLAIFSGGKGLRGPQASGLILGRSDLVQSCAMNTYPHHSVGRAMKTSKENVVGLLFALKRALSMDWDEEYGRWKQVLEEYRGVLSRKDGLRTWIVPTGRLGQACPRLFVDWSGTDSQAIARDLDSHLMALDPGVAVGFDRPHDKYVFLNPYSVLPEEEDYLIRAFVSGMETVVLP